MSERLLQKYWKEIVGLEKLAKISPPLGIDSVTPTAPTITIEGFGISQPGSAFNTGWRFSIRSKTSKGLLAFTAGSIILKKSPQGKEQIVLYNADLFRTMLRAEQVPDWFPRPERVIYKSLDLAETRNRLEKYLSTHSKVVKAIQKAEKEKLAIKSILDRFFAQKLKCGIPVYAGLEISAASEVTGTASPIPHWHAEIQIRDTRFPDNVFVDPAIYFRHLSQFTINLHKHPSKENYERIFAGLVANGTVRYVDSSSAQSSGSFTNFMKPAKYVSDAIKVSDPYDTIVLLGTGIFQEKSKSIRIDKSINLTSLAQNSALKETSKFPTLLAPSQGDKSVDRVVTIKDNKGLVSLSNLEIKDGHVASDSEGAGGGGGILIDRSEQVYVSNCVVSNNRSQYHSPSGVSSTAKLIGDERGYGGGILIYYSSPYIVGNRVTGNTCVGRGAGIAIFGYSWPVIEANHIIDNDTLLTEKTDGGGIAIVTAWFKPSIVTVSDANKLVNFEDNWDANGLKLAKDISSNYSSRIIKNRIAKNRARDDGGGIYMTNLATAFLHDNQILQNKAGNAGGGIRVTFGSLIIISGGEISQNVANTRRQIKAEKDADGNSLEPSLNKNGGGGLSVRNSSARLTGVKVEKNKVEDWAGGGIFFSAADAEAWYFKKALNKVFEISEVSLKIDSSSSVKLNHVTHEGDGLGKDHRKGGGLYVLRYKNDEDSVEGLPISIEVDDVDAVIGGNLQDQSSARPPLSVKSPSSKNLHIEDFYHRSGKPIDDSNKASFVKKKKLKYTSS